MPSFIKIPFISLLFFQFFSLSSANTKLPPPPPVGDYLTNCELDGYLEVEGGSDPGKIVLDGNDSYLGVYPRVDDENIWASISHLVVNVDSVVEFHGIDGYLPKVDLDIGRIDIALNSILVIKLNSATGVFAFRAGQSNQVQTMRHIAVEVNGELKQSRWIERNGWYYLNHLEFDPWVPLPEASTYGAAFSFSALAVGFIRRRKKRRAQLLNRSLIPT